jgi:hypothetical protein
MSLRLFRAKVHLSTVASVPHCVKREISLPASDAPIFIAPVLCPPSGLENDGPSYLR